MADWRKDPKAIEALDYLIGIGVQPDDFDEYFEEGEDHDLDDDDDSDDDDEDEEEG